MRLKDRIAVVTGAARGIGAGIAQCLAREGAKVLVCDIDLEGATATAKTLAGQALPFRLNVADRANVEAALAFAVEHWGDLHIWVNNAGINRDAMLHKMTDEQWHQVIDVDLTGVFYGTRAAAQYLRDRGYGRIINISSGSWLGNVGQANYAAAKAGVVGLTKTAARELARKGVTANVICPGFIDTQMTRAIPDHVREDVLKRIPLGKPGDPTDVGNLVAFLASDEAAYLTGELFNVAGGYIV